MKQNVEYKPVWCCIGSHLNAWKCAKNFSAGSGSKTGKPRWSHRHANVRNHRKCFPSEKGGRQDQLVGREKLGERNRWKQHRVTGDTVITESEQNIPWKGNCLYFHSWKFRFAFSVQIFFTCWNPHRADQSEFRFINSFQFFSNVLLEHNNHATFCQTGAGFLCWKLCHLLLSKSCVSNWRLL